MYIPGISAYHSGDVACLIHDGRLIAAVDEKRFRRINYCAGFPAEAIKYCLRAAAINPL
jgi:carbamoyltransferase